MKWYKFSFSKIWDNLFRNKKWKNRDKLYSKLNLLVKITKSEISYFCNYVNISEKFLKLRVLLTKKFGIRMPKIWYVKIFNKRPNGLNKETIYFFSIKNILTLRKLNINFFPVDKFFFI